MLIADEKTLIEFENVVSKLVIKLQGGQEDEQKEEIKDIQEIYNKSDKTKLLIEMESTNPSIYIIKQL